MIIIRKLTGSDTKIYREARLYCLKTYPDKFGSLYEDEIKKEKLFFEECLENATCDSFVFGALNGKKCIGLCGFVPEKRSRTKHRGEIIQMFVHEDYRGQKTGEKLLLATIADAFKNPVMEQIILGVMSTNKAAMELYTKLGFVEYGFMENYFKTPGGYMHQSFLKLTRTHE